MRHVRSRAVVVGLALAVACAGCTAAPDRPTATAPPAASESAGSTSASGTSTVTGVTVDAECRAVIDDLAAPPENYRIFADVVALNVDVTEMQLSAQPNAGARYFVKTGLLIRPTKAITMSVAPDLTGTVAIGWGTTRAEGSATTLTIPACPGRTRAAANWLVFAGGYYVAQPTCVPLVIRAGDLTVTARIPVGAACT